jgi:hypothetical protein
MHSMPGDLTPRARRHGADVGPRVFDTLSISARRSMRCLLHWQQMSYEKMMNRRREMWRSRDTAQ